MQYQEIELVEINGEWYFEDATLAGTHDRQGPNATLRRAWMKRKRVVECKGKPCLGKVTQGKAHICRYYTPGQSPPLLECAAFSDFRHVWFDHCELFWHPRSKTYVLTAQPYDLALEDIEEMECLAGECGMVLEVSMVDAWWYPGRTPLLIWRRESL